MHHAADEAPDGEDVGGGAAEGHVEGEHGAVVGDQGVAVALRLADGVDDPGVGEPVGAALVGGLAEGVDRTLAVDHQVAAAGPVGRALTRERARVELVATGLGPRRSDSRLRNLVCSHPRVLVALHEAGDHQHRAAAAEVPDGGRVEVAPPLREGLFGLAAAGVEDEAGRSADDDHFEAAVAIDVGDDRAPDAAAGRLTDPVGGDP